MKGVSVHGRSSSATYMPNSSWSTSNFLRSMNAQVYPAFLDRVAGHVTDYLGPLTPATCVRVRTTRMERASGRRGERIGHFSRHRSARPAAHTKIGHGIEQHPGIRVPGPREEL